MATYDPTYHKTLNDSTSNRFPRGWCTYYAASKLQVDWRGNAGSWFNSAKRLGYEVGQEPMSGSLVVLRESRYGHVAYVESINSNKETFKVSEMNYRGFGVISEREISFDYDKIVGFIY